MHHPNILRVEMVWVASRTGTSEYVLVKEYPFNTCGLGNDAFSLPFFLARSSPKLLFLLCTFLHLGRSECVQISRETISVLLPPSSWDSSREMTRRSGNVRRGLRFDCAG